MSTLSADDAALLHNMRSKTGGRLYHNPPCVQCGDPGLICRMSLRGIISDWWMDTPKHDSCDPYALCFECAKAEYTATVIAGV